MSQNWSRIDVRKLLKHEVVSDRLFGDPQSSPGSHNVDFILEKTNRSLRSAFSEKVDSRVRQVMLWELKSGPKSSSEASNFGSEN